jgi:hypothetical protein
MNATTEAENAQALVTVAGVRFKSGVETGHYPEGVLQKYAWRGRRDRVMAFSL